MKINIYYGGRGILGDPSLAVINKMQQVLAELNVKVERYSLFEQKSNITALPASINDADAIVLASTVEWFGVGGYLMEFLDACWLYGNKEKIARIYMYPVIISQASGEREAKANLQIAWEKLGGISLEGMCGYVDDPAGFEMNESFMGIVEKQTENLYRSISQKVQALPTSSLASKQVITTAKRLSLTPQETEQLSKYASDETYVQKQKEDIRELSDMFKGMLEKKSIDESMQYISDFEENYRPDGIINVTYNFLIDDKKKALVVEIVNSKLKCYYSAPGNADVSCKVSSDVFNHLIDGQMTFQRAFMTGEMQLKGDFRKLAVIDQMFTFQKEEI